MKYHVEMTHNEQRLGNVIKRLQNELAEAEHQRDELATLVTRIYDALVNDSIFVGAESGNLTEWNEIVDGIIVAVEGAD